MTHLVAELAVGHAACPLLVARGQQARQQVARVLAALAVPPDDAVDDVVDLPDGPPVPPRRRQRQIVEKPKPAHRAHEVVDDDFERLADDVGLAGQLGAEQRLGDDRQRQVHHVFVRVADLAVVPGLEHALGVLDHHGGVALDLLALKRRLGQPALPPPEITLAGQEPLADQWNQPPRQLVLHEIVGVRAQDIIDMFGIDQHVGGQVAQPQPDDVAVLLDGSGQEAELIAQVGEGAPQEEAPFRPGRQLRFFVAVAWHREPILLVGIVIAIGVATDQLEDV